MASHNWRVLSRRGRLRCSTTRIASGVSVMAKIRSTDLDVFPGALGGNVFGWTADEAESFTVLDGYVAGGGNLIDTADAYSAWVPGNSGGESETIIGAPRLAQALATSDRGGFARFVALQQHYNLMERN